MYLFLFKIVVYYSHTALSTVMYSKSQIVISHSTGNDNGIHSCHILLHKLELEGMAMMAVLMQSSKLIMSVQLHRSKGRVFPLPHSIEQ